MTPLNEFKTNVGDLVRPHLFDMEIEGYDKAKLLIHTVNMMNGEPHHLKIYENSDFYVHTMLDDLMVKTEADKTFLVTLNQYGTDGALLRATKYKLKGVTYEQKLSWDMTNQVQEYDVYVDLEKA